MIRERVFHRLLNGNKRNNVKGLVNKKIVRKSNKQGKIVYELTLNGIFLVLQLFSFERLELYSNNKVKKYNKKATQHNYHHTLEFLNTISKNYAHLLPLIFGKWELLIKNKIDFRLFANIPIFYKFDSSNPLFGLGDFDTTFPSHEEQFTVFFYYKVLKYSNPAKIKKLLSDENVKKLILELINYKKQFFEDSLKNVKIELKVLS